MRYLSILLVMSMCAVMQAVTPVRTVLLYPNGAPDSNGYAPEDEYVKEGTKFFRTSVPRLDLYVPASATAEAPCPVLLVCPGGGYSFTSTGNEGIDVANYFLPRNIAIAVLKYRMPNGHETIPLADAMQAMRMLRDSADKSRPDYGVLVYPVISMSDELTHKGSCRELLGQNPTAEQRERWSADKQVTADTPPCVIVACQDDRTVKVANSLRMFEATAGDTCASLPTASRSTRLYSRSFSRIAADLHSNTDLHGVSRNLCSSVSV